MLQATWILAEQDSVFALLQRARCARLLLWGGEKLHLSCRASHVPGRHTVQCWHLVHLLFSMCYRQCNPLRSLSPRQHATSWLLSTKHCRILGSLPELWLGHAWCWGIHTCFYLYARQRSVQLQKTARTLLLTTKKIKCHTLPGQFTKTTTVLLFCYSWVHKTPNKQSFKD